MCHDLERAAWVARAEARGDTPDAEDDPEVGVGPSVAIPTPT